MTVRPATGFVPEPSVGRTFTGSRVVRLGDVDQDGELRLDAFARYLQDVATDDALDADLTNAMGWLVRRTMIRVERPARLNERVALTTFCSGSGRSWAERRTTLAGADGARLDGVSLWVQIDIDSGRPARLDEAFHTVYGEAAGGRIVSSKLSLAKPPAARTGGGADEWFRFRSTDLDPFGHVNNAAQWSVLEAVLDHQGRPRRGTGELEFLAPAPAGRDLTVVRENGMIWLIDDGVPLSAFAWTPAEPEGSPGDVAPGGRPG